MATERTTNPYYPMDTRSHIAHDAIGLRDATVVGRASPLQPLEERTGGFSGALILLVKAVEETPDLGSEPGVVR